MTKDAKSNLTPKLRFPEFRNRPGWEERRLGEFLSQSRLPGSKGNVARKITVKLWGNGVLGKNESFRGSVNTQYFRRKAGQFIYSKLDFLNQAFGIIPPCLDDFESTVDLPCFDIAEGLDAQFLLEYVKRKAFYERLGETADGSRKARRIHADTFLSFTIALPDPAEQHKIASCLSSLDDLIATERQKLDALKAHKNGLMQQLFPREGETTSNVRFSGFWEPWKEKALGAMSTTTIGEFVIKTKQCPDAPYPVFNGGRSHTGFYDQYNNEGNKILISARGANAGYVNIIKQRYWAGNSCYSVSLNDRNDSLDFVYWFMKQNEKTFTENQHAANIPAVSKGHVECFKIMLPSHEEQHRIASCLSSLADLIAAQSDKIEVLKTHKKGLMQQLFPAPSESTP